MSAAKRRVEAAKKEIFDADVDFAPTDVMKAYEEKPPERFTSPATLVSIELPVGDYREEQHRPSHIEARLSPKQGRALQRLRNGLNAKHGRGWSRKDCTYADVLRWLLDQLPDAS